MRGRRGVEIDIRGVGASSGGNRGCGGALLDKDVGTAGTGVDTSER